MAKKQPVASVESTPESSADPRADRHKALLEGQDFSGDASDAPEEVSVETPPVEEEEIEDEPVEVDDAPESDFLNRAKQLGYEAEDEHAAAMQMLESYQRLVEERETQQRRLSEMQELAEYGTQFLRQQREREQQEQKQAAPPPAVEPWWSPPKFETKWIEQYRDVKLGEDGQPQIGWKESTPREVREAAESYQQYLEQWATDLVQRPHEVLPKVIEQEFDRLFEERIQQRDETVRVKTLAEQIKETNRDWMYTTDGQGREALTEQGQLMTSLLNQVAQSGVSEPALQWQYAVAMYDYLNRSQSAPAAEPKPAPKETAEQKRRRQLDRGVVQSVHNRTGTVPRPDEDPTRSQNPHLSPGRQLLDQLRREGAEF